jgi:hypothetical protein
MRSINELLSVVLDNFDKYFNIDAYTNGICILISSLENRRVLTSNEVGKVKDYIRSNPPSKIPFGMGHPLYGYYWKPGKVAPRKRWLRKHIKLTA